MLERLFARRTSVTPEERETIITYLVAEWQLRAVQDDEAGEYNAILTKYGAGLSPNSEASKAVAAAAERMAEVNRQLVQNHRELSPVLDAAGKCYFFLARHLPCFSGMGGGRSSRLQGYRRWWVSGRGTNPILAAAGREGKEGCWT